jgi:hypothetical protein
MKSSYETFCYTNRFFVKKDFLSCFHVLYSTLLYLPPIRFHCVCVCADTGKEFSTDATLALAARYSRHIRIFFSFQIHNVISLFIWFKI